MSKLDYIKLVVFTIIFSPLILLIILLSFISVLFEKISEILDVITLIIGETLDMILNYKNYKESKEIDRHIYEFNERRAKEKENGYIHGEIDH